MKIVLLLANVSTAVLKVCKECITEVLGELDIDIDVVELTTLPFYKTNENSPVAMLLAERLEKSKGVIALSSVHVAGIHSSVQCFLEHMTQYKEEINAKPMLTITYSENLGERQAAYHTQQAWTTLGGVDAGTVCFNKYINQEVIKEHIERNLETFYRVIKQERSPIRCSEFYTYEQRKLVQVDEANERSKRFLQFDNQASHTNEAQIISQVTSDTTPESVHVDLSTQEQNIKELTQLLKGKLGYEAESEFVEAPMPIYGRPKPKQQPKESLKMGSKLAAIPHYFIAKHDKAFQVTIQYVITDLQEKGAILIAEGDCAYQEGDVEQPNLEILLSHEVLEEIMKKQLTYQKAFMIGKLKVKGNFGILAKLDQVFGPM